MQAGGVIILHTACPEGIGEGRGADAFRGALDLGARVLRTRLQEGTGRIEGGAQRAYVLARTLSLYKVVLVGAGVSMPELHRMGIQQFATPKEAQRSLDLDARAGVILGDVFKKLPRVSRRVPSS